MPSYFRLVLYGLIILAGALFAVPNLLTPAQLQMLPQWLPKNQVALGLDLKGGAHLVLEMDARVLASGEVDAHAAMEQSLEVVRKRIDAVGVAEPTVQALGADRILVQLPGVQDPAAIRTLLGSTAKLTFHRVSSNADATIVPAGYLRMPDAVGGSSWLVERAPVIHGERLNAASASIDQQSGEPIVTFRFDERGAKQFAAITLDNVGKQLAIVLDGKVISAPVIQQPIAGGAGQISGRFTTDETASLAALLRAGALPVPLTVIEERTVGADLGSDAIRVGALTGLAGLLLVLVFMTVLYGAWGLVANFALVVNVALTLAALSLLGATLTLPGIAGIILGIGLAVDANVLINERIREETRNGKSARAALEAGFNRAYATIVDSNVTTLIATVLLFCVGTGPVRGFAITMALGIAISMFTAVAVVRVIMSLWVSVTKERKFVIGTLLPEKLLKHTPSFRFMRARYVGVGLSLLLSLASMVLFFKPGLNYGVDFTGGVLIEASTPQAMNIGQLRAGLEGLEIGEVSLQELGSADTVLLRIEQPVNADEGMQSDIAERTKAAVLKLEPTATIDRVDIIGPKVSSELAEMGALAVLFASIAMLIYIWVRFEWQFAVGAITTLVLDATKTIGLFALTGIEFNLTAIAALLTIIGYSVNDKVVVYDRIRENLKHHPAIPFREIIDGSINQTLARSLYTSATAFLAILPMAIWGGAVVESFAVPMVFGIVVAASSSVFIAAPILLFLGDPRDRQHPQKIARAQALRDLESMP